MSNDAEAQEVHATVAGSEEPRKPVGGYQDDQVAGGENEPAGRDRLVGEDELDEPDAVIIVEGSGGADEDLDEADDDTNPGTVVASAIVVEPVSDDDSVSPGNPVSTDGTISPEDTVSPEDTISPDGTVVEPVSASSSAGPRHAADSGPVRPGMPVNGDVPTGSPMAGDADQLHERWAAIQSTFVDDPRGSVTSAADMVTEVIATVVASAKEREAGLRSEWQRDGADTEDLRNALRSYRSLLDQLVAL